MTAPKPGDVVVERRHRKAAHVAIYPSGSGSNAVRRWVDNGDFDEYSVSRMLPAIALALATIEHNARPKWTACSVELPDSDIRVLIRDVTGEVMTAELEFTDDSEGHGEPYWSGEGGDFNLDSYPHWMPLCALPEPPKEPTK